MMTSSNENQLNNSLVNTTVRMSNLVFLWFLVQELDGEIPPNAKCVGQIVGVI